MRVDNYYIRAEKIFNQINQLAAITEEEGCLTRRYGTDAFVKGAKLVEQWMQEAGLTTRIDTIGNVRGILYAENTTDAPTFVMASHIDTVVNAGKFDGPLGVIMAIDLIKNAGFSNLPFNIEVIAFSDEEGVRFHTTFLGSKVVTGAFDNALLQKADQNGIDLATAMQVFGGNINQLQQDAIPANKWLGYFEMHIEQGPVLYEKNIPVALVTAIAGQKRISVTIEGFAGHAGTVPMGMRKDALCTASAIITAIESFAIRHREQLVATVGTLQIPQSASNVIPGKVQFSIDVRSANDAFLAQAVKQLESICTGIAEERQTVMHWQLIQATAPVLCSNNFNEHLANAIQSNGHELVQLVSGAGHDAVPISQVAPVSMLFIRCYKGISHHPMENTELPDVAAAIAVAETYLKNIIQQYSNN